MPPQVENGEQPVYKPGTLTIVKSKIGDNPVAVASDGTNRESVGITTPKVAEKKLMMDADMVNM